MIDIDLIGTSIGSLIGKETNSISSRLKNELLPWFEYKMYTSNPSLDEWYWTINGDYNSF